MGVCKYVLFGDYYRNMSHILTRFIVANSRNNRYSISKISILYENNRMYILTLETSSIFLFLLAKRTVLFTIFTISFPRWLKCDPCVVFFFFSLHENGASREEETRRGAKYYLIIINLNLRLRRNRAIFNS